MKKSDTHQLIINNLHVSVAEKPILKGISLQVNSGEVHAVMGPNGSGKSTLAYALLGHPSYHIESGKKSPILIDKQSIADLEPELRVKAGLFLAFQSPIAIPGVSVMNLLRTSYQSIYSLPEEVIADIQNPVLARRWQANGLSLSAFTKNVQAVAKELHLDESFLKRSIHDGFSGGEKKKIEMLQALVLSPKFAIFDEIDTGLDVDALRFVAHGIDVLAKAGTGVIIITHYQRILSYLSPDAVHVLVKGQIIVSGGAALAKKIELNGYKEYEQIQDLASQQGSA